MLDQMDEDFKNLLHFYSSYDSEILRTVRELKKKGIHGSALQDAVCQLINVRVNTNFVILRNCSRMRLPLRKCRWLTVGIPEGEIKSRLNEFGELAGCGPKAFNLAVLDFKRRMARAALEHVEKGMVRQVGVGRGLGERKGINREEVAKKDKYPRAGMVVAEEVMKGAFDHKEALEKAIGWVKDGLWEEDGEDKGEDKGDDHNNDSNLEEGKAIDENERTVKWTENEEWKYIQKSSGFDGKYGENNPW